MTTKPTKRGRPKKRAADAKSESLLLRLSPGEKQGFQDAADLAGVPLTVWIRERLRANAAAELGKSGGDVPFLS